MPGSNIICQGLSAAYNSLYLASNNLNNNEQFSGLSIADNTLIVQSPAANFPFATGDLVYFSPDGNFNNFNLMLPYHAIVLSPTQMRLATSLANAQQGIFINIDGSPVTNVGRNNGTFFQKVVSNCKIPVGRVEGYVDKSHFVKTNFLSSAYSSQNFFLQDKIAFDFTLSDTGVVAGITTVSNSYGICVGRGDTTLIMGRETTGAYNTNRFTFFATKIRMTVNSGIISVAYLSGNNYVTAYTTAPLSDTTACRLFSFHSLNNTGLRDCIITYL